MPNNHMGNHCYRINSVSRNMALIHSASNDGIDPSIIIEF